jgi:aldose 1-epimerase
MDFRTPTRIGEHVAQATGAKGGGYDHCYVVTGGGAGKLVRAATVSEPKSGRAMECWTTEPGVQLFTPASIARPTTDKSAATERVKHGAFCLETQHFPDAVNRPNFPGIILRPGETHGSTTVYRFFTIP